VPTIAYNAMEQYFWTRCSGDMLNLSSVEICCMWTVSNNFWFPVGWNTNKKSKNLGHPPQD